MQLLGDIFGSRNNVRVLRYLANHQNWEFNISELSKDIKINKGVLSRLIKKLKGNNLIKINPKGRIVLFRINKENIIIKNLVIPIFKIENNLFNDIIKPRLLSLKSKNIISIILYGSYASRNFKLTSDIDLLIIVKENDNNLKNDADKIKSEFLEQDLILRIDLIKLNEFKKLYKLKEPLILSMQKNYEVLYGSNFDALIK